MAARHQWLKRVLSDSDVKQWRQVARTAMHELDDSIRASGRTAAYAPEMPPLADGLQGFITQPYRALMTWIPEWSYASDLGSYVLRVDTMVNDA